MALTPAKQQSVTGKAQGDGAQTFTLDPYYSRHQLQFEPSAAPSAGTMTFEVRTPGATAYQALDFTMDLTGSALVYQVTGNFDSLKATPASFDAAKTYALHCLSSRE